MKITTTKIDNCTSRICADGKPTEFVVVKGDDPKWGDFRDWHVGLSGNGREGPYFAVHRRKADALEAFRLIYMAGFNANQGGK